MVRRGVPPALFAAALAVCVAAAALADGARAPSLPIVWVTLGGETFALEVAADPDTRFRGLSGRARIGRNTGLLFVFPGVAPRGMVMRDCAVPIDVAFLDDAGRVVAVHAMEVEPPRRPGEGRRDYERRLPVYASSAPARFAIETAGGRLAQLGLRVGDRVRLDAAALAAQAR